MMMEGVGPKPNVVGMSIAIAADGPIPGRTPTRVPMKQPINANKRFVGCNAKAKPFMRKFRVSIRSFRFPCLDTKVSDRQADLQPFRKRVVATETSRDGDGAA